MEPKGAAGAGHLNEALVPARATLVEVALRDQYLSPNRINEFFGPRLVRPLLHE